MRKTHYDVLQVSRDASPEVIRAAYRARQRQLHPDLTGVESGEIRELNEAYGILNDPVSRREYDKSLEAVTVFPDTSGSSGSMEHVADDWGIDVEWDEPRDSSRSGDAVQDFEDEWGVEVEWDESQGPVDTEHDAPSRRRSWQIILRNPISLVSGLVWLAITGMVILGAFWSPDPSTGGFLLYGAAASLVVGFARIRRTRTRLPYFLWVVICALVVIAMFVSNLGAGLGGGIWLLSYVVAVESGARSSR